MKRNEADPRGFTELMLAVGHQDQEKAAELIRQGADLDAQNHAGETALLLAVKNSCGKIVRLLVDGGADVNLADYDCNTPLLDAVQSEGDLATVSLLLAKGARVNGKNCRRETPLHKAAAYGYSDLVQLLIEQGAGINQRDINGDTPLHRAAGYGWEEIAALLLAAGADQDIPNNAGESPLQKAVRGYWNSFAEVLISTPGRVKPLDLELVQEQLGKPKKSGFVTRESAEIRAAARDYHEFIKALNKTVKDSASDSEVR